MLMGVRVDVALSQAAPTPQPASPTLSASSAVVSLPPYPVQRKGQQSEGQGRKGETAAGTGEGGNKGRQAAASGKVAEVAAAGAARKGEERGKPAAAQLRVDPFNLAESDRLEGSVFADILVISKDEGEEARRMAMEGGQWQPTAPNVPAAAMKSILPEVQRRKEGKGRRGQTAAGAAERGDSGLRKGGQGQTGKGGKGQVGASGVKQAAGHEEGKGGKGGGQGYQWPRPQHSFRQLPPWSPRRVSAAVRAEEERGVRRQQTAQYKALARMKHQRRHRQAPKPGPKIIYRLEMGSGRGRSERQGEQEGTEGGHSSQPSGGPQGGEGQPGRSADAAAGHHGQREGGQEGERQRSGQAGLRGQEQA